MSVPIHQWAEDTGRILPENTDGLSLHVLSCYSCGQQHENISLHQFSKPNPPWTHWFTCPISGDPVCMTVVLKGETPVEQCRKVIADLDRAMIAGRYLSAIFYMSAKDRVTLQWVSEDFPHKEYETCQKLLADECAKQGGLPAPVGPLPRANPQVFDASKLFGPKAVPKAPARELDEVLGGNTDDEPRKAE